MSEQKIVKETKKVADSLETAFGIPSGTTEVAVTKKITETEKAIEYDNKDIEIEKQLDMIKDMAQYAFETIQDDIIDIEPKYRARLHEVNKGYIDSMLDAVKSKAKIKMEKDKLNAKKSSTKINHTTNNTIISSTTDVIESLKNGSLKATIDGDFVVTQENDDDQ